MRIIFKVAIFYFYGRFDACKKKILQFFFFSGGLMGIIFKVATFYFLGDARCLLKLKLQFSYIQVLYAIRTNFLQDQINMHIVIAKNLQFEKKKNFFFQK